MKKIILYILTLIPLTILSQELDEEFLDSLPESVRKDVLDKIDTKTELDKPVYRRASTRIDKDIEDEDEDDKEEEERRVFGADFFDTIQSSFMPINEPNFDSSYILDFGDVIEVQLLGQNDSIEEYEIQRDGSINIKDIGKIFLSGLFLKDAASLIESKVKLSFIGTKAYVSLKNVRDISVLISGNAYNPGIYVLNGNSNVLHALGMAGGINDIGSYRNISLIREGKEIEILDMYEILINGKTNYSTRLRSGDSIVVNPSEKLVSVESGVLRPGIYELKDGETFDDLINFASGLSMHSDTDNIILKRVSGGSSKVIDISYKDLSSYEVYRGDGLFIREYKYNSVTIKGAVKNPGTYMLPLGTKLSELINSAGGYDDSAYSFGGFLKNKNSLEIDKNSKEKLYNKFLNDLITKAQFSNNPTDTSSLAQILEILKDTPITGRVIAEFDLDKIKSMPDLDTILEDKDEILIPNITQQVYIQGEVSNPGAIRYSANKDINYYIKNSGGVLPSADNKTIFIVHPNGETQNISSSSRLSFISYNDDRVLVYPGSIIYVPRSSEFDSIEIASIWAPIISSVALSLTSLSVLNRNN
tara:strand:+ start:9028 stop:10791 length:1764 start_codon:yes stop_codon:yes gene_type:complete